MATLGYTVVGNGKEKVIAAHTWLADHQTYAPMMPFIDHSRFTYVFPDFRGYGKSKSIKGEFNVREMGRDLLALADALSWKEFHLVGNSMGGQCVQWLAGQANTAGRIKSVALLASVPASGLPLDEQGAAFFGAAARDVAVRGQCASVVTCGRLGDHFATYMSKLSAETATEEAIARYLNAWVTNDVSAEVGRYELPVRIFVGQHDPVLTAAFAEQKTAPLFPNSRIATIDGSGHYPPLETPAYTAALLAAVANEAG
jgi:pimeloyl-ACP methyl ester carboxylesterase